MFAIQCWWVPRRTKQLSNVAILLYRIFSCCFLSCSISVAVCCVSLQIFWADQISCRSHVRSVYRMRSLTVSRFSTLEGIRFEFWIKGASVTVEICVLCGWRFLNHLDIVLPYSCDTVGRELYRTILRSLLCPETDWKIHVGKQGYVFILTGFQKGWS